VKTSDSDVSSETIEDWKSLSENLLNLLFESEESNVAVLDFIRNENIDVLTILTYKRGFSKGLFQPSYIKKGPS
jgi:hypothetical protein